MNIVVLSKIMSNNSFAFFSRLYRCFGIELVEKIGKEFVSGEFKSLLPRFFKLRWQAITASIRSRSRRLVFSSTKPNGFIRQYIRSVA